MGYRWIRSLYEERFHVEKETYELLKKNKVKSAILRRYEYESKRFSNDDEKARNILQFGSFIINSDEYEVLKQLSKSSPYLGFQRLWDGKPQLKLEEIENAPSTDPASKQEEIKSVLSKVLQKKAERELNELKKCFEYGIINCVFDSSTCPKCAELSGRKIELRKAKIGSDFPPFHEGCRCFVSPYEQGDDIRAKSVFARNPITEKTEYTHAKDYKEWTEQMSQKEIEALKEKRGW